MPSHGSRIVDRQKALQAARDQYVNTWQTCYDFTMPLRGEGFHDSDISVSGAQHRNAHLTDNTATESIKIQASMIMDGMTPANALWFLLDVGKESDDEKRWLHDAANFLWENIHASNFDAEAYESVIELLIAGWFCLFIRMADEDDENSRGFEFQQWPISQVFAASTRGDRRVNIIHRKFKLTALQAIKEYGRDVVSDDVRKAADDNKIEKTFCYIHAIEPRENFEKNAKLAKNMRFASFHVEEQSKHVLRESGFHEFPCAVPRWMVIPASVYGLGPTYDALADIGMVNEIKRLELANLDLAIAGMWIAEDDGVLNPRTISVGPRKIITANSVNSMKPLTSGTDFNAAFVSEERVQQAIKRTFNADVIPPLTAAPRPTVEIIERQSLVRKIQGPIFGRFQSEYLQPLIERCFGIAFRAGALGTPPASLVNRNFNIKYISPLARAQRLEENNAIDAIVAGVANIAAVYPEATDKIDIDKAIDVKADALGVPADVIRTEQEVADFRQQRAENEAAAQDDADSREVAVEGGKQAVAG